MSNQVINKKIVKAGEKYLTVKGYEIIDRNYECPFGKVDFVTLNNNTLQLVEVKAHNFKNAKPIFPDDALNSFEIQGKEQIIANYLKEHYFKDVNVLWSNLDIGILSDDKACIRFHINSLEAISKNDDKYVYHDEYVKQFTRDINDFMNDLGIKESKNSKNNFSLVKEHILNEIRILETSPEPLTIKIIDDCYQDGDVSCIISKINNELRFTSIAPDNLSREQKEACMLKYIQNNDYLDIPIHWDVANIYEKDKKVYVQIDKDKLGISDKAIPLATRKMNAIARATKTNPCTSKTYLKTVQREVKEKGQR